MIDPIAGYYVSELIEKPIHVYEIRNCLELLDSMQVAVLIKRNQELREIKERILQTTNKFSIIKWSNLQ